MTATGTETTARSLQALLDRALIDGQVDLGTLSDIDECVLGQGRWVMNDPEAWERWQQVPEWIRIPAIEETLADLARRGAAATAPGPEQVAPSPEIGAIVTSRTAPALVLTFLQYGSRPLPVCPLAYALNDTSGLVGYVIEVRSPDRHDYQLVTPTRCARGMSQYAANAVAGRVPGVGPGPLTLGIVSGASTWGAQLEVLRIEESRTIGLRITDPRTQVTHECPTDYDTFDVFDAMFTQFTSLVQQADEES